MRVPLAVIAGVMGGSGPTGPSLPIITNLAAWYRYGKGITQVAGAVSQWDDSSGNLRHLLQVTGAAQPALQGDNTILFDGTSDYLQTAGFTLNQPTTIYLLGKQVTWTATDRLFDGLTLNSGGLAQITATPEIDINNGGGNVAPNTGWAVNTYAAVCVESNGASSLIQVNNNAATTGVGGAINMGGFTLGASGTPGQYGNLLAKEVIIYTIAHDATQRAAVIAYLNSL